MRGQRIKGGRGIVAACLALWLAGCATGQTGMLGPAPLAEAPRVAGLTRQADRDHAKLVAAFGGEYRAPSMKALLSEAAARIVPATERPDEAYQITILDSPVVNAFALPSGRLYVTRGLLALANDTSEIAAVLAHEIAHVALRHASARLELEARSALVSRVVADVLGDPGAGAQVRDQSRYRIASFSRAQELEADQVGVKTLAKAGYDPYGAARFLSSLGRTAGVRTTPGGKADAASPYMLSTHPGTSERVALALQAARRIGAPGLVASDRARYLAAIDGLAYGEDPANGVVRGQRFIHPRLSVAFEAPDGIVLENTPRAVLGSSDDGNRRLLFDAVEAPEGQSLAEVLRSTWSDAVETGSIENLDVSGHPAAMATSRGKEWTFRLGAIRIGSTTYRLVLAARSKSAESEGAFRHMLDSVRQVSAEEGRSLRPLRVQAVTAAEGDTADRLASRMIVPDRPVDRFLILNGLERGGALTPGERYKIVVE
jgi:predicted Zn-dependent protease